MRIFAHGDKTGGTLLARLVCGRVYSAALKVLEKTVGFPSSTPNSQPRCNISSESGRRNIPSEYLGYDLRKNTSLMPP